MDLKKNNIAAITGAAGGIGTALAKELSEHGFALALSDVSKDGLDKLEALVKEKSPKVTKHVVDVTDAKAMEKFAQDVEKKHGGVNLLINNAGITLQKSFSTHSIEDWQHILGINLWGVIHGCHYFDELLAKKAPDAHVVNMSSMAAFAGLPAQSSYCASKAFVEKMSASLWAEWKQKGIGVTHVHPGAIRTDMILATLDNSDDPKAARKSYDMAMKIATDVDKTAQKIIRAVSKKKKKIRIGTDSFILDYLSRLAPWAVNMASNKIAVQQTVRSQANLEKTVE